MSLSFFAGWASTEQRRRTLAFYGGGVAAVLAGAWTVFTYFVHPEHKIDEPNQLTSASVVQNPTITVSPTFNIPAQASLEPVKIPPAIKITDARKELMWSGAEKNSDAFPLPVVIIVEKKGSEAVKSCSAELWVAIWKKTVRSGPFILGDETIFNFEEGNRQRELQLIFDITLGAANSNGLQVRMRCGDNMFTDWTDLR